VEGGIGNTEKPPPEDKQERKVIGQWHEQLLPEQKKHRQWNKRARQLQARREGDYPLRMKKKKNKTKDV